MSRKAPRRRLPTPSEADDISGFCSCAVEAADELRIMAAGRTSIQDDDYRREVALHIRNDAWSVERIADEALTARQRRGTKGAETLAADAATMLEDGITGLDRRDVVATARGLDLAAARLEQRRRGETRAQREVRHAEIALILAKRAVQRAQLGLARARMIASTDAAR